MQSLAPSKGGVGDRIASNEASILCHASTETPLISTKAESHGNKKMALETKKPSSLPLNQNKKPAISTKLHQKQEIPASIEACDVSSLLDKFLEYELNQNATANLAKDSSVSLTPVSSPSHKRRCNLTEAFNSNKKPTVSSSIGLTPPVSPPSHQSLAAKCTPTSVIIYNKGKETPTSTKSVMQSTKQIKGNSIERVTSELGVPSDGAMKKIKNIADRELATISTLQNVSETPEKSRNGFSNANKNVKNPTTKNGSGQRKSQEAKTSSLQFAQERKERPARSSTTDKRERKDYYHNLKRSYSSEDDDNDKDYYDYKRKKYAPRDECYWSTSEEESDERRKCYSRRRGNKKPYSRRRHRSHCNSSSDDNHSTHSRSKCSTKSHKQQRRKETESKKENCGDENDDERKNYYARRQGNKETYSRRRHRSHSSSSGSDDSHSTYNRSKMSTKVHKQQRRNETESKKENCGDKAPVYDIETERKKNFKLDRSFRETATEKRKIVYIGKIKESMSKDDVWRRFREYGPIEKVTVHYRNDGDNYSFVTFIDSSSALEAIERGSKDPDLKHLDICFGGRRKFCGGSYVDFDSNTCYLEEKQMDGDASSPQPKNDEMDFDTLLKMCQRKSR